MGDGGSARLRRLASASLLVLFIVGGAVPAAASPDVPTVEVWSPAGLVPDARSIEVTLAAECPDNRTLVDARVTVMQPQASGEASFPIQCDGVARYFTVTVPSSDGAFQTGEAQVSALLAVRQGRAKEARDTAVVPVVPLVEVALGDQIRLIDDGAAVLVEFTAACPASSTGVDSVASAFKYPAHGSATFVPTCDGRSHAYSITVSAADEPFEEGDGSASARVNVEEGGEEFYGVDFRRLPIVQG